MPKRLRITSLSTGNFAITPWQSTIEPEPTEYYTRPGQVAPDPALDTIRIVEQTPCISAFSRNFEAVAIETGEKHEINCRSWRCERHRDQWGRKWGALISENLKGRKPTLLVNLTTAEMIDFNQLEAALRFFIKRFRIHYGPTEYVKVVEYNKRKTQPHFHLILCCEELEIPPMPPGWKKKKAWPPKVWKHIKFFWEEALSFAAPALAATTITWNQPPKGDGGAAANYAVGYVTGRSQKRKDKDEEPDSTWRGRKLTYSRQFFTLTTAQIWERLLDRWFPDRDRTPYTYFWQLKDPPGPVRDWHALAHLPVVVEREQWAEFYRRNGKLPSQLQDILIIRENELIIIRE